MLNCNLNIARTFHWYKFHRVCSLNGVITSFDLSKDNHADIQYFRDIEPYYSNCLMLGDKAYLDSEYQLELFESRGIQLYTPMRSNQKNFKKQPALFRKVRKRIQTLFSQLVDQFVIRVNNAKIFIGSLNFTQRVKKMCDYRTPLAIKAPSQ
ncbi:MAG: transposase [Candidatus Marinimicrobia bacterium]|nr:transposase [Candidatus Neomarinimicrobiota bacterium]